MALSWTFTGGRELQAALLELPKASLRRATMLAALKKAGDPIASRAWELSPRGFPSRGLADSIKVRVIPMRLQSDPFDVAVAIGPDKKHFYGIFLEFRTSRQNLEPRPFLTPAWDQNRTQTPARIGRELWASIARTARRLARRAS